MLDTHPTYPAADAYVVQLHREARPEMGLWIGRIEHVATGASLEFEQLEGLLAWTIAHVRRVREEHSA